MDYRHQIYTIKYFWYSFKNSRQLPCDEFEQLKYQSLIPSQRPENNPLNIINVHV